MVYLGIYTNPSWQIQETFFKILERKFPQTGGVLDMQNDRYAKLPLSQSTFKMADKYAQMAVHQWSVQNFGFFKSNYVLNFSKDESNISLGCIFKTFMVIISQVTSNYSLTGLYLL